MAILLCRIVSFLYWIQRKLHVKYLITENHNLMWLLNTPQLSSFLSVSTHSDRRFMMSFSMAAFQVLAVAYINTNITFFHRVTKCTKYNMKELKKISCVFCITTLTLSFTFTFLFVYAIEIVFAIYEFRLHSIPRISWRICEWFRITWLVTEQNGTVGQWIKHLAAMQHAFRIKRDKLNYSSWETLLSTALPTTTLQRSWRRIFLWYNA